MSLCSSNNHSHSHSNSHSHGKSLCHGHEALHEVPSMEEQIRASESFKKGVLVAAHMAHLHDAYILEMATHPMTVLPPKPASPSSLPALDGFKPLRLRELKEGKVHRRRFIQGSLSVQSLNMHVVANILEDEDGNAVNLWIRNAAPRGCSTAQAQCLFPQGSRVSIREPYLTRSPSGVLVLLVEKPEDLIFLWVPELDPQEHQQHSVMDIGQAQEEPAGMHNRDLSPFDSSLFKMKPHIETVQDADMDIVESIPDGSSAKSSYEEAMPEKQEAFTRKMEDVEKEENGEKKDGSQIVKDIEEQHSIMDNRQAQEEPAGLHNRDLFPFDSSLCNMKPDHERVEDAGMDIVQSTPNGSSVESSYEENGLTEAMPEKQEAFTQVENIEKEKNGMDKEGKSSTDGAYEGKSDTQKVEEVENEVKTAAENNGDFSNGNLSESSCGAKQDVTRELDPYSGLSATELRLRGSRIFSKGNLGAAAELYSRSIQKARSEDDEGGEVVDESGEVVNEVVMGLSNRAEVWLRLEKFDAALEDAETALAEKGAHLKSLFRKARSLMGLQRYDEALVLLKNVQERSPKDADVKAALLQCRVGTEKKPKPGKKKRAAAQKQQQKLSS